MSAEVAAASFQHSGNLASQISSHLPSLLELEVGATAASLLWLWTAFWGAIQLNFNRLFNVIFNRVFSLTECPMIY